MPAAPFSARGRVDAVVVDNVEPITASDDVGHARCIDQFDANPKIMANCASGLAALVCGPGGYVGAVLVSDLRHFLDMPDDVPGPARRLAVQLGAIVRAGSARPVGSGAPSGVGCTRRPGRRPCNGFVMVFRHANGEISWACDVCEDDGVITGWEGSPSDLSELDDSYVDGESIEVVMPRELFDRVRGVLLLDAASEVLVARAQGCAAGVVLAGAAGAFEELVGYVASEANAATNRRRARLLDEACAALEAALDEV